MATSAEDADALFGGSAAPEPAPATGGTLTGFQAPDVRENRRELRVKVSWPGRLQLPGGKVIEVRVRDLSDNGVGLVAAVAIPSSTDLVFAMGVPALNDPARVTPVTGRIRTSYIVLQGRDIYCGGNWSQLAPESRDLIASWLRKKR